MPDAQPDSPFWSTTTKAIVAVTTLVLAALVLWRFQSLLQPLVLALLLAYLLNPLVRLTSARLGLKRSAAVLLVYGVIVVGLLTATVVLGVVTVEQALRIPALLPDLLARTIARVQSLPDYLPTQVIALGPYELHLGDLTDQLDWNAIADQALGLVRPLFSQGGSLASQVAQATVSTVGLGFLVLVLSVYIAIDMPNVGRMVAEVAHQSGYRRDAKRLMRETVRIWDAYLRGQLLLGLVIGVAVSVTLALLGVGNALALGIFSGVMEFLPVIGPLAGAGAAILVALFQQGNYLGLSSLHYALLVAGAMLVIQQLENNILVPRIVGDALDLHPLLVMISVLMGASLAGILGAILAAPVVASLKLVGVYAWRKLLDLPPFPEPETGPEQTSEAVSAGWPARLAGMVRRWAAHVMPDYSAVTGPDARPVGEASQPRAATSQPGAGEAISPVSPDRPAS